MSDTLREALEELAQKCRDLSTYKAFTPGARKAYEFMLADVETILEDHATILAAHPADAETEWGVATIADGFSFGGCSDRNPDACNCNTWTPEECAVCCEEIEDGQEIYSLARRGNPALPDDDENQHWEHFFKHAECPEVSK